MIGLQGKGMSYRSRRFRWRRCRSRLQMTEAFQPATRCFWPSACCASGGPSTQRTAMEAFVSGTTWASSRELRKISKQLIENLHTSWPNSHKLKLTVVILSSDKVSGVSDDEVLRRCAVFLIFLFAAWTMLATNRDELSRCESRLLIVEIEDDSIDGIDS